MNRGVDLAFFHFLWKLADFSGVKDSISWVTPHQTLHCGCNSVLAARYLGAS